MKFTTFMNFLLKSITKVINFTIFRSLNAFKKRCVIYDIFPPYCIEKKYLITKFVSNFKSYVRKKQKLSTGRRVHTEKKSKCYLVIRFTENLEIDSCIFMD